MLISHLKQQFSVSQNPAPSSSKVLQDLAITWIVSFPPGT